MRKILVICGFLFLGAQFSNAQSFKDFFNKKNLGKVASSVGVDIPFNIEGSWKYSGIAVKMESEDVLKRAAASVAAIAAEEKVNEQLSRLGIDFNSLVFSFAKDGKLQIGVGERQIPAEYILSPDKKVITLLLTKKLKVDADVQNNIDALSLLFDADKLLKVAEFISDKVNNKTIKGIADMAKSYDGMKIGFQLERIN